MKSFKSLLIEASFDFSKWEDVLLNFLNKQKEAVFFNDIMHLLKVPEKIVKTNDAWMETAKRSKQIMVFNTKSGILFITKKLLDKIN